MSDVLTEALAEAIESNAADIEAVQQEAITERSISSDNAAVEIAQIQADAAVEIASQEVEEEWLATQFAGVAAQHQVMLETLARIEASLTAMQILLPTLALTPTPQPEVIATPVPETAPTETPPESSENTHAAKRRIRRLL